MRKLKEGVKQGVFVKILDIHRLTKTHYEEIFSTFTTIHERIYVLEKITNVLLVPFEQNFHDC